MKSQLFVVLAALLFVQINCKTINNDLVENTKIQTQAILRHLSDNVKHLKEKVDNLSVDKKDVRSIKDCIEAGEAEIKTLLESTLDSIKQCGADDFDAIKQAIENAIDEIRTFGTQIEDLWNELEECGSNIICIAVTANEIVDKVKELPDIIKGIVDNIEDIIGNSGEVIKECVEAALQDALTQGEAILDEVKECIKNEILN